MSKIAQNIAPKPWMFARADRPMDNAVKSIKFINVSLGISKKEHINE